jgi:hypothetical protein
MGVGIGAPGFGKELRTLEERFRVSSLRANQI